MNNSYRSLWNAALASWVAVPETARACGAGKSSSERVSSSPWRRTLLALALVSAWAGQAPAATKYWDVNGNAVGIGGGGTWTPTDNFWSTNAAGVGGALSGWSNAALDDAFFSSVFGYTVNLGAPATVHNLDFGNGVVLTGSILTLGGPAPTVSVVGGASTINSVIAGTAGVIKTGGGYLLLGGTNTFTGGIRVNGGQLHLLGANSANGANNVVTVGNGGDLIVTANSFGGDTAAARLVLNNGGALTLSNGASFTHDLTLGGGSVSIDAGGTATWNGTAVLTADTTLNFNGQNLTVTGNLRDTAGRVLSTRYAGSGYTNTVTGNQSYSGGTVVTGPGTTIFSGASNTYAGDTLIEGGGLLVLNSAGANSANSNVVLGSTAGSGILSLGTGNSNYTEAQRSSLIQFSGAPDSGAVLGLTAASGDFTRALTTATASAIPNPTGVTSTPTQDDDKYVQGVRWLGSGGFAAFGVDRSVNLGGAGAGVTWDAGGFVPTGQSLILGYVGADRTVDFVNPIDLGTIARTVNVANGSAAVDAVLSGVLSDAGALVKEGAGTLALTAANTYGGTTTVNAGTLQVGNGGGSGTLGAGNVSVATNSALAFNRADDFMHATTIANNGAVNNLGSGTLRLPVPITGTGTVNQNSSGTMVLSGTHTYTGRTTVNAGTLRVLGTLGLTPVEVRDTATLDGTGRIGGGVVVRSGGTFAPGGAATPGALTVGSLVLDAGAQASYRFGAPNVVGGPLNDLTNMPGSLSLGGTLNIIDAGSFASTPGSYRVFNYGGTLTNPAGLALGSTPGYAPGDVVVQTSVAGQVNLIASQAGLPISFWDGPNVTANSRVDGGTDAWNNSTGNWTNANGAINQNWIPGFGIFAGTAGIATLAENVKVMGLQFTTDGYVVRGAGNTIDLIGMPSAAQSLMRVDAGVTATLATSLVGTGGLEKKDAGTLVLSGANTYGGGTTVTAGRLQVGDGGATGNLPGDVVNNAELMFKRSDTTTYAGIVSGTGKFVQAGSGNLTLTGANTYTGGTLVSAGTLTGNTTSLQGPIVTEATLAFDQAAAGTFGAPISGAGELVKLGAGNLTLTGTHSYSGGTVVKAGTLTGTTGSLQGAIVNLADVVFDQPGSGTYAGVMSGTGNLTKAGAGVLTLTGTSTYAGHTALVGGSMWVNGALANTSAMTASNGTVLGGSGKIAGLTTMSAGSTLSPGTDAGAIGHLSLGALILTPASTLDFDLSKPNVIGPQNDRIDVDGNLTLAGTLHVTDGGQFASMPGSYRLINYGGTLTGNAASLALGTTPGYAPGDVLVQTSVPHQVNLIAKLPGLGLNFWDGRPLPSSLHNGAIEGGDGVWNNVASSWVDKVADFNSPWLPGMAIFSGAKGTVSLGENVDAMAMQFITDGYVIEGAGHTLRLLGMQGGSAPSLIRVDPGTTATIAANMIGTAGMLKGDTGTLVLSGANSYSGNTLVTGGTLKAGAPHTLSAVSAHSVSLGTTLDTAGFDQRIAGLTNAGTVSLQSAAPGSTLTVTGPYVGNNGVLRLGAVLGVDGRSDRLVLDGPGATASGRTTVQVTNLGGLGGPTVGNGIEVVTALNGATTTAQTTRDAFVLAGSTVVGGVKPKLDGVLHATHVDAGAYEYYLHAADADGAGENWYLRSARPPEFLGEVTPIGEGFRPLAGLPTYRVEVPLFAALPHQLRQGSLAMLGNMHQRIGDEAQGQGERHAWARVITTNIDMQQGGTVRPVSDGRVSGLQAGTDLWTGSGWRAGVYGGQLEGDVNVRGDASGVFGLPVGSNDLRSQFVGVYGTYMNASGFYADTVLQAGRHRYTVKPVNLQATSGKGDSLLASIEVGQSLGLGEGWSIEPQLQIIHQQMDLDDVDIPGANIHQSADSGWVIRVGARVKGDVTTGWGRLQPYGRFNVYRSAGGTDVARFTGPGAFADIASLTGSISSEFAGGATLTVGKHVDFYGEAGTLWAYGGHDAKVRSSLRASAGVRMRW
jgi:fibronectin-binding autotransporter adhesin